MDSPEVAALAALRHRNDRDEDLLQLMLLAEAGLKIPVVILSDGHLLAGVIGTPEFRAQEIDEYLETGAQQVEEKSRSEGEGGKVPEKIEALLKTVREISFTARVRQDRAEESSLAQELERHGEDWTIADLEPDLARRFTAAIEQQRTLTLVDARVKGPLGNAQELHRPVQIGLAHVAAWWFGRLATTAELQEQEQPIV